MFIGDSKYAIIRALLAAILIAGIFKVHAAHAEMIDFGWAQRIGGKNLDYSTDIAVDESGYVYTSGFWRDNDSGDYDAQIYKWNPTGTYLWLHGTGGLSDEIAYAATLDEEGNVYAAGAYSGTVNFGEPNNTYTLTSAGLTDIFILKYSNEEILSVRWAKGLGGISSDSGHGMTVDTDGNVYVTGTYMDTVDFDPSEGVSNLTSTGDADVFVLKLDEDGNFLWAKSIGGSGSENSFNIAVDENGNVFTTGYFHDTADFDPGGGTSNLTSLGERDIFISKLDSSGNFVWARRVGGGSFDGGVEITLDGAGNAYMAGYSYGAVSAGNNDILISKLDQIGNFAWTKSIGGIGFDASYGIALDEAGNIYTTGEFTDTVDFDPGEEISNLTSAGASDIFISKLDNDGNYVWAKSVGGISNDVGEGLVVHNGSLFLTGAFSDTVDFDPGAGTNNLTSVANLDVFVTKLSLTPQIHYVKWDASGANDGSSWEDAYTDLQSALSAAVNGDEIWVAAGTYKPTSTTDRTLSFTLKNGVAIYGGFAGTETSREQRDDETNVTVLSGNIGIEGDNSDNSYHVVVASDTNHSAILDGFTISAGNASDQTSSQNYSGGGMYINRGSPWLNEVVFTNNQAGFGGGLYVSDTELDDSTVDLILTNVVFKNNTAAAEGGGMATRFFPHSPSDSLRLSLTDVFFENNSAVRTGGGMINNGGELELVNVTFIENTARGGGGLSNIPYGTSVLTNVIFSDNFASDGGGGMLVGSSGPVLSTLTNVTFSNNSTDMNGGGMANTGSSELLLTNVTFSDNTAGASGGGISNGGFIGFGGGTVNLINTTFSDNTARSNGGAIYNESGNINVHNSILYGDSGGEIANNSGTAVVTYSIVHGGYTGDGNLDENPLLGPLQNNGGFTQTMALGAGSPAIDAGDDAYSPDTDQRGVARPQRSGCDIGAYEYDGLGSTVDVIIGSFEVDSYILSPHESQRSSYTDLNDGPVKVVNMDDFSILTAERVIYKVNGVQTSFSEMMGLPDSQVDNVYWLPWYNNVDLDTQLRIANVTDQQATITVTIGGVQQPTFNLAAGESTRMSYPGVNSGPVKIESTQNIVAAERVIYKVKGIQTSFSEMMALPDSQLDTIYWLPWYNNVDLDTQLRIANASNSPATVHIYIGDVEMQSSPFTLAAGESMRKSFPGINDGPVRIESDADIVAAQRVIYKVKGVQTSFCEMMALPAHQLDTKYWLPWYNDINLDTQLRFANTTNTLATVHVYIGGQEMQGSPFTLPAGESKRQSFTNINSGPVQIVSDVPIVAAERVIYKVKGIETSFSEMMALPNALLYETFWFPWYNNVGLDTQLRFGVP